LKLVGGAKLIKQDENFKPAARRRAERGDNAPERLY
jgi:hypothetical protein